MRADGWCRGSPTLGMHSMRGKNNSLKISIFGDLTFSPATIDPTMILTTKSLSEGNDWVFGLG